MCTLNVGQDSGACVETQVNVIDVETYVGCV
jgi:hypothetical protein